MSERKGAQGDGFVNYLKPIKPGEYITEIGDQAASSSYTGCHLLNSDHVMRSPSERLLFESRSPTLNIGVQED